MTHSTEAYSPAFAADAPAIAAQGRKIMHVAVRNNAQAFRAMMRFQFEAIEFMKRRFEQDLKLVDDLVAAEEPAEAFDVLAVFWQNAATEYASEAGKVARIGSKIAAETAEQVRKDADTAVRDMAAQTVA